MRGCFTLVAMDVKRELELLRATPARRAQLLKQPPRRPTRAQLDVLAQLAASDGAAAAEDVPYRTGLVLTARRWARLKGEGEALVFRITEAGRDVLARYRAQ